MKRLLLPAFAVLAATLSACVPGQPLLQVPTFQVDGARLTSITLPGGGRPATATLTIALRVQNPNPLPLRVANIGGAVTLDGEDVGHVDFPNIALPARGEARQQAVVTLPITFANAGVFLRVARGQQVAYRVDGTFTVDAGPLGRPTFGPYTLVQGVLQEPAILP
ncbi:LEA type 2 family protein [Deinococcus maricopensis]|uniref:Water Stress and Hypersensitive response domain-containing protein n=1 Tax=Deinococcus maricopensis (strain DSM 21211 / LMG 22137 / NRRL B-23946 / LB-34) TaxID=709986 RepID=E8U9Z0_DEIML|nr:LEA type 2 family protein [Deinococcus maricopensis]ADV67879.1 Water Stress and Hypersensitive response domain-containing protein [Deinococcus maricopensis DSM 21211]